jgi:uncharacterized protein with GYD domain
LSAFRLMMPKIFSRSMTFMTLLSKVERNINAIKDRGERRKAIVGKRKNYGKRKFLISRTLLF